MAMNNTMPVTLCKNVKPFKTGWRLADPSEDPESMEIMSLERPLK